MKKVKHVLLICLVVATSLAYSSVWVSPAFFKLSAAISIAIPVFICINLILFIVFLFRKSPKLLVPLILLFIGYPFFKVGFSFGSDKGGEGDWSIMSYNVKHFADGRTSDNNVFDFIKEADVDFLCIQEFTGRRKHFRELNSNGNYHIVFEFDIPRMAILSKHPIIQSGALFENEASNNILFADVVLESADTLRVYNLHLESMSINASRLQDSEDIREDYQEVKTKFLDGAAIRARQIKYLMEHVAECPYPVVMAGDFNDMPFSYNYFQFRKRFKNAFEEAGSGFGVTFNDGLPLLRIDNQFYGKGIEIESFHTFNKVNYSDHFPILGIYSLSD